MEIKEKALKKMSDKYDAGCLEHDGGLAKAPDDLVLWLESLQEELMDGVFYIEKALDTIKKARFG